ncbi:disease resistance response protein 206 [Musa troglodytarum]|uniref:Dirigent protein n=1 Tax=Musa troglodytarum TaxID=320322 RepID=A0A9E7GCR5_9LILI|nr:disease resistance response protein 206 [Musa troglodytarum]
MAIHSLALAASSCCQKLHRHSSMASSPPNPSLFCFLLFFLLTATADAADAATAAAAAGAKSLEIGLGSEKSTHLRVYFHEVFRGANVTSLNVVKGNGNYPSRFGNIDMIDAALRTGADARSRVVGRAQGVSFHVSQEEEALLIEFVLLFTGGEYAGSTMTVVGRVDAAGRGDRAVVGGTGRFLLARGHMVTQVLTSSVDGLVAVYDIYVMHYDYPRHA